MVSFRYYLLYIRVFCTHLKILHLCLINYFIKSCKLKMWMPCAFLCIASRLRKPDTSEALLSCFTVPFSDITPRKHHRALGEGEGNGWKISGEGRTGSAFLRFGSRCEVGAFPPTPAPSWGVNWFISLFASKGMGAPLRCAPTARGPARSQKAESLPAKPLYINHRKPHRGCPGRAHHECAESPLAPPEPPPQRLWLRNSTRDPKRGLFGAASCWGSSGQLSTHQNIMKAFLAVMV